MGSDTPRTKVDIVLQIRQMTASFEDKGHILLYTGFQATETTKIMNLQTTFKSAAKEMVGKRRKMQTEGSGRQIRANKNDERTHTEKNGKRDI